MDTTEVLTNDAVVRLVRSGLSQTLITKMIQDEPTKFDLTSAGVIRLKQQGVPESVLTAMLSKKADQSATSSVVKPRDTNLANAKTRPNSLVKSPNYTWEMQEETDAISGRHEFSAVLYTPAMSTRNKRLGDYEVTARCNPATVALQIVFLSDETPPISYKQNDEGLVRIPDSMWGDLQYAHLHKRPWTETRIRFEKNQDFTLKTVTSEKDFLNESEIYFKAQQITAVNFIDAFGIAPSSIGPNQPAGLERELFEADRVLLESTFTSGTTSILEIHPQNRVFQAFAARCTAMILPPPPAPKIIHTVPQIPANSRLVFALDQTLDVRGVLAGTPVMGRLLEPLHAATDAMVTLYEIPAGTPIVLRPSFVGVTANQIKHSLASENLTPTVRLEIDHLVANGTTLMLKTSPLDRPTKLYTEPYVPPAPPKDDWYSRTHYHPQAKLPGPADGKKSIVATSGERIEMRVSETMIPDNKK